MSRSRSLLALAVLTVAVLVLAAPHAGALPLLGPADSSTSSPQAPAPPDPGDLLAPADAAAWAPLDQAAITPGVATITGGKGQCTSNFVFTDGDDVYLGQAAHCASLSAPTAANGCQASTLPLGTEVSISGVEQPGTLVYSSWHTMQEVGETNPNVCRHNDFALVEVPEAAEDSVNPTVPVLGGPEGLNTTGIGFLEPVYSYGSSQLRPGPDLLAPKFGLSTGTSAGGWNHSVYNLFTPGIPGDSGAPVLDSQGNAAGVLSTLVVLPQAGANQVTDLARALRYANQHTALNVQLVPGTQPFSR